MRTQTKAQAQQGRLRSANDNAPGQRVVEVRLNQSPPLSAAEVSLMECMLGDLAALVANDAYERSQAT